MPLAFAFTVPLSRAQVAAVQDWLPRLRSLLASKDYERAGELIARFDDGRLGIEDLGESGAMLLALPEPALDTIVAARPPGSLAGRLAEALTAVIASHRGDPVPAVRILRPLLAREDLRHLVVVHVGRGALQLCRSGRDEGREVLEAILGYYPRIAESWGNLALGLRFLGAYAQADQAYRRAVGIAGRQPWILNDWALLQQARGDTRGALGLLLEGVRTAGPEGDRDNCRTNAALLLLRRGEPGDRDRAKLLLETVVAQDKTRLRARYWLAQISRKRHAKGRSTRGK